MNVRGGSYKKYDEISARLLKTYLAAILLKMNVAVCIN